MLTQVLEGPIRTNIIKSIVLLGALATASCGRAPAFDDTAASNAGAAGAGTIKGHVRLMGAPPENPAIRMRADPMCETANAGRTVLYQSVMTAADGSLANVFVQLQGTFPDEPVPKDPVVVDQRACVYLPRIVGVRVGQPLRVLNSDPGLHNVHGVMTTGDLFNIGQPLAGMANNFSLKDEGIVRLKCDVHGWMVAFIGVVSHPYFAVTGEAGTFELRNVPAGTYTIETWHEQYGRKTTSVKVDANATAQADFTYAADTDKPDAPR